VDRIIGRKSVTLLLISAFVWVLSGCGNDAYQNTHPGTFGQESIGNPTPADFLDHEDADIFYFGGVVYSNAEHLDWVKEKVYTKTELLGEITKQTSEADEFTEGAANKLPVGTQIYRTDAGIFVAVVDGKEIRYYQVVEG
jgi:hypothetical protein